MEKRNWFDKTTTHPHNCKLRTYLSWSNGGLLIKQSCIDSTTTCSRNTLNINVDKAQLKVLCIFWTFQLKQNSDWVEVWGRWTNRLMLRSSGLQGKRCNTTSEYITITVLLYIHVYVAFDKNNFLIYLFLYILLKRCIYNWIIGIDVLFMICFIFLAPIAYYFQDFRT